MLVLDAFFRGAAMAAVLLFAVTFWRARPNSEIAWIASLFAAGVLAFLVWNHSASLAWLWRQPGSTRWPRLAAFGLAVLALPSPFFFWGLARLIFDDGFRLRVPQFLWFGLIEGSGLTDVLVWQTAAPWLRQALGLGFRLPSLALVVHALWVIARGRRVDLVESRARLRFVLLCGGAASGLVLLAAILYAPEAQRGPTVRLGEAAAIMLLSLTGAVMLTRVEPDLLPTASPQTTRQTAAADAVVPVGPDATILARIDSLMARDEVWREQGLTIGGLASRVGIPEYRLRRLINQRLGFRNFTAFVNEYRLSAAATRLADPAAARIPVLTIALDLGWGSIGPFNRAFRARFDMTPTDYRRTQVTEPTSKRNVTPVAATWSSTCPN